MGTFAWGTGAPRTSSPPPPPPPAPVARVAPAPAPRVSVIPYYDPSRIITDIQVVKDLRQSGTERGETQSGDGGMLGPGSIAPPSTGAPGAPGAPGKNNLVPIALAIGAFLLLGG